MSRELECTPMRSSSLQPDNELPPTIHVGLVGLDGVVLASDSEIKIYRERGIAIACAKNIETSEQIADEIAGKLTPEEWEEPTSPIEQIARKVLAQPSNRASERKEAQFLIATMRPRPRLFFLQVQASTTSKQLRPVCQEANCRAIAGDAVNSAVFWCERFYQPNKPVRTLVRLAAQVVVAASKLNSVAISGLEIVVCEKSGIRRLSDKSISRLQNAANHLDAIVNATLAGYAKAFTYV